MRQKTRWGQIVVAVAMAVVAVPRPSTSAEQGTITGFAGTGSAGYSGDGGPAEEADLNDPRTVAVDGQGNVFIADTLNNVIRKVDTTGVITTVAGTGTAGEGGDGGPATAAQIQWPHGVAVDRAGNVYIADSPHHRIRRVDTTGVIATVAGTGRSGFGGDGGPATAARLDNPKGVAVDDQGRLYIADTGNGRVRRLEASGTISTVAGNGDVGGAGDGGPATTAQVTYPRSISLDGAGDLFISEDTEGDISRIRKVDTAGVITRFAGTGVPGFSGDGGPADQAQLNRPRGIAADRAGNLYIADSENNRIRKVDTDGVITTIAGTGRQGSRGDGGSAADAELSVPRGLGVAPNGDLYVADTFASRVRRISGAAVPATQPPPPRPPVQLSRRRSSRVTAAGSEARVRARTTTKRVAPAATRSGSVSGETPPVTNTGRDERSTARRT
jgi:sugar lactone lactonase YvrE